jgi:hypothetical protein
MFDLVSNTDLILHLISTIPWVTLHLLHGHRTRNNDDATLCSFRSIETSKNVYLCIMGIRARVAENVSHLSLPGTAGDGVRYKL